MATPTVVYERGICKRCKRVRQVRTTRSVTGSGKIVASVSKCVDEEECDRFVGGQKA